MDSHKALEEQLDGLATFVEGELASTRVEKVKNRKNSIAGVEMMLKSIKNNSRKKRWMELRRLSSLSPHQTEREARFR